MNKKFSIGRLAFLILGLSAAGTAFSLFAVNSCSTREERRNLNPLVNLVDKPASNAPDKPGAGHRVSLDSVYFSCITNAAAKFAQIHNELPRSLAEVSPYLFVNPDLVIQKWTSDGDRLEITALIAFDDGTSESASFVVFRPGSHQSDENLMRVRDSQITLLKADLKAGLNRNYSVDDIASGSWSNYYWHNRWAYSKDTEDFKQLTWSMDLAKLLFVGAKSYKLSYGTYPSSPSLLLDYLGQLNPDAWIAPAKGNRLVLDSRFTGANPSYICAPGLDSYEIIVPLFGAGRTTRGYPAGPPMGSGQGYYPGECVRYTSGMMVAFP